MWGCWSCPAGFCTGEAPREGPAGQAEAGRSRQEPVTPFWSREQAQNITIPENLAPGSKVAQVRAQGSDVRYEILSPAPCPLFSIGRGEGLVVGVGHRAASVAGLEVICGILSPS